jgi:hypothetical protein
VILQSTLWTKDPTTDLFVALKKTLFPHIRLTDEAVLQPGKRLQATAQRYRTPVSSRRASLRSPLGSSPPIPCSTTSCEGALLLNTHCLREHGFSAFSALSPTLHSEAVLKEANVILNGAKRSEESAFGDQILRPTWETVGLRMTFGTASRSDSQDRKGSEQALPPRHVLRAGHLNRSGFLRQTTAQRYHTPVSSRRASSRLPPESSPPIPCSNSQTPGHGQHAPAEFQPMK